MKLLQKTKLVKSGAGFTLIELLVVISIMVLLVGLLTLNLAGNRAARDIKIAESQLVSNIRKIQGYTLSARTLSSGESVQYYILKFDLSKPKEYKIQALTNVSSQPTLRDVETVNLPPNVTVSGLRVTRPLNPTTQTPDSGCLLVAFAAPFGKTIFNDGCVVVSPPVLQTTDDYYSKIINFQSNVVCLTYGTPPDPAICSASTDSILEIFLAGTSPGIVGAREVIINAITGLVCPSQDGSTCKSSY